MTNPTTFPSHEEAAGVDRVSPEPTLQQGQLKEILNDWPELGAKDIGEWPSSPNTTAHDAIGHSSIPREAQTGLEPIEVWTASKPSPKVSPFTDKPGFLFTIGSKLAALNDWLSGPGWSDSDNRRRQLAEAEAELRAWRLW